MGLELPNMSNFQPLEVVARGSETQPQVVENVKKLTQDKGYYIQGIES